MRGADASAGTIKSGGATRRAAKMVVLDVDHPDIEEFIETKVREEEKIRVLRDAGFDMDLGGKDITSRAVPERQQLGARLRRVHARGRERREFGLRARTTGEVIETVDAKRLFRKHGRGGVGVRRSGHPVRRHDQRLAHQPRDRSHQRVQPVLGVHEPGQLVLQPGLAEPADVPQGRRHLRRASGSQGRRVRHHGDGHLHLLRRLPDRGDRRHHPPLPPARHRLRQPRRAADGHRAALRLRRRSCARGGHHQPDDRHRLQAQRRAGRHRRALRGLRPQHRRPHARHAQARRGQRQRALVLGARRRRAARWPTRRGRRASQSARRTAGATRRPPCWRPPGPSAS